MDNKLIARCTINIPIKDSSNDRTGVTSKTYPIQTHLQSAIIAHNAIARRKSILSTFVPGGRSGDRTKCVTVYRCNSAVRVLAPRAMQEAPRFPYLPMSNR